MIRIPEFIDRARNAAGSKGNGRAWESFAGGPNPDFIVPLINGVGRFYPELTPDTRRTFAKRVIGYLDGLRYDYSQNHVEQIEEPWLARDILLDRNLYWPGYRPYIDFLNKFRTWEKFNNGLGLKDGQMVKSPFWLTLALIHPKYSSLEVRKNYYSRFGSLVDRTLDAVGAIDFELSKRSVERKRLEYEEGAKKKSEIGPLFKKKAKSQRYWDRVFEDELEESINRKDPLLHDGLRSKINERNWEVIK